MKSRSNKKVSFGTSHIHFTQNLLPWDQWWGDMCLTSVIDCKVVYEISHENHDSLIILFFDSEGKKSHFFRNLFFNQGLSYGQANTLKWSVLPRMLLIWDYWKVSCDKLLSKFKTLSFRNWQNISLPLDKGREASWNLTSNVVQFKSQICNFLYQFLWVNLLTL